MRRADQYKATQNYPLFKGYLDHFNSISIDNEIPGMFAYLGVAHTSTLVFIHFGFSLVEQESQLLGSLLAMSSKMLESKAICIPQAPMRVLLVVLK
jgi:hypothetical protein